jgi:hypothetical protein
MVQSNYEKYHHSTAHIDLLEFADRTHWIIAQDGWEEVAGGIHTWLTQVV